MHRVRAGGRRARGRHPDVGTNRRAVAIEVAGGAGVVIGPDTGLAPAVAIAGGAERAVELTNPEYQLEAAGVTFAGRDIFAPAAATCATASRSMDLGDEVDPDILTPGTIPLPGETAMPSSPKCSSGRPIRQLPTERRPG